jgi:hypothetical protein
VKERRKEEMRIRNRENWRDERRHRTHCELKERERERERERGTFSDFLSQRGMKGNNTHSLPPEWKEKKEERNKEEKISSKKKIGKM